MLQYYETPWDFPSSPAWILVQHSCETQLISLGHDRTHNYDTSIQTDLIFYELCKSIRHRSTLEFDV